MTSTISSLANFETLASVPLTSQERSIVIRLIRNLEKIKETLDAIWWIPTDAFCRYVSSKLDFIQSRVSAKSFTSFLLTVVSGLQYRLETECAHYGQFIQPPDEGSLKDPRLYLTILSDTKPLMLLTTAVHVPTDMATVCAIHTNWETLTTSLERTRGWGLDTTTCGLLDAIVDAVTTLKSDSTPVALYPLNDLLKSVVAYLRARGRIPD